MRKIIFSVLAAIAAITCSAKSSWPTSAIDDVYLTCPQMCKYPTCPVSKYPAVPKFPKYPSWPVEPVCSWPE